VPAETATDEFGTDAAHFTEIEFEILQETFASPEEAFNSFINYVNEHHSAFDDRLRKITLDLAERVADSYRGVNRKEAEVLEQLKHELSKID